MAPFFHSKVSGGFTKEMPRLTVVVLLLLLAVLIWLHFFLEEALPALGALLFLVLLPFFVYTEDT